MGQEYRRRRLFADREASWSAVSDRDVQAIASIFVREHGPRAARQAGEWADLMLLRGDRSGHAAWRRILWAIEERRHLALRAAASQPGAPGAQGPNAPVPALFADIDEALEGVICKALSTARDTGQDDLAQTEQALRAAQRARPGLSVPEALSAVQMARRR